MNEDEATRIALFRYQVIAPLLTLEDGSGYSQKSRLKAPRSSLAGPT